MYENLAENGRKWEKTVALCSLIYLIIGLVVTWGTGEITGYSDGFARGVLFVIVPTLSVIVLSHRYSWGDTRIANVILWSTDGISLKHRVEYIAEGFPYLIFISLISLLVVLGGLDWVGGGRLTNQVYGLTLDGAGGFLLARETLRVSDSEFNVAHQKARKVGQDIADRFWGAMLLTTGFALQGLAVLYWPLIYEVSGIA